jgi:hypothetical protein
VSVSDLQSGADERSDRTLDYKGAVELQARLEAIERALSLALRVTMIHLHWWYEEVEPFVPMENDYPYHGTHWHLEDLGDPNGDYYRLAHLARLLKEIGEAYGIDSEGSLASDPGRPANVLRELIARNGAPPTLPGGEDELNLGLDAHSTDPRAAALPLRQAHREGRLLPPWCVDSAVEASGFDDQEIDRAFSLLTDEGRTVGGSIPLVDVSEERFARLSAAELVELDYGGLRSFTPRGIRMLTLMSEYASRSNEYPTEWEMSAWQPHPVFELLASLEEPD